MTAEKRKEIDANQNEEPIQLTQPKFVAVPIVICLILLNRMEIEIRKKISNKKINISKKAKQNKMFTIKIR